MLRKIVILGIFAGSSATIPIVYQIHPDTFHRLVQSAVEPAAVTESEPEPIRATARPQETLPGKKVRVAADAWGHFLADFKLNGRVVEAMVDTGATLVAINASTARRIGIKLKEADFKYQVETANGATRAASANIGNLQIGRIYVENVQAVVLEDKALSNTLIGMSFLNRLGKFQVESGSLLLVQ